MKLDYIKSVMQFIKDDNELSSPLDNQEWDDFLEKLGQLANTLEEYYTPDNEGNYKTLDDTDVYCFKNMYKLDAKISTTYRVDSITEEFTNRTESNLKRIGK